MKISLAQLNPTIGDFEGNIGKIERALNQVKNDKSDLVVFSELFLSGYPPQDLLEKKDVLHQYQKSLQDLIGLSKTYKSTAILCGTILPTNNSTGKGLFNSAVMIQDGRILFQQHKSLLPTYDVFDEVRYFDPAPSIAVFNFKKECLGITICEDAWNLPELFPTIIYPVDPVDYLVKKGATILINISASPFSIGKEGIRYRLVQRHVLKHQKPFILLNQVGSNDELISDGNSMVMDKSGKLLLKFPAFKEHIETIDLENPPSPLSFIPQETIHSVYEALLLGIRDYVTKCGFQQCVLGLSGGIDSAVTCCLARDALGSENVLALSMPSLYSSRTSIEDAHQVAKNLKVKFKTISITSLYHSYVQLLKEFFSGMPENETEENIQARIRGNILMAFSNKFGYLVLSSGNKSELAVGYCTLYGDMVGGLGVLSDVPKTTIYQLANYINRKSKIIPKRILDKPPSAELKPHQKDQDVLPPYEILDRILSLYLEEGYSKEEMVAENLDLKTVEWVIQKIKRNEYKRKQAPPGLKITDKAFGIGRRMPIAAK